MKKITKLKICNWSLLALTIAILISGIQLEATHSIGLTSVWIHILIAIYWYACISRVPTFRQMQLVLEIPETKESSYSHPVVGGFGYPCKRSRSYDPLDNNIHSCTYRWSAW